jgi:hypothetical protein
MLAEVGSQNKKENPKKGGNIFKNLAVPFGVMVVNNDHRLMQKYAIDLNSSKTLALKDPLYDALLNKIKG